MQLNQTANTQGVPKAAKQKAAPAPKGEVTKKNGKEKKRSVFYYAWPPNLMKEIGDIGYGFTTTRLLLTYAGLLVGMVLMGVAFKLPWVWWIPIIIAGLLFAPTVIRNTYKNKWEWVRFSDVNVYIEQMLYSFKNSQKVLTALQDTSILFLEGSAMREVIEEAILTITRSSVNSSTVNIEEQALAVIEARYPNQYINSLHRFLLKVEGIGGNFDNSIDLLLSNRAMWENRVNKLQDKRKKKRQEILGSCIASALLCLSMLYLLPDDVNIGEMVAVRIANVFMIIAMVWIYLKADTKLASNLVTPKAERPAAKVLKDYDTFMTYDPKAGFKSSLKFLVLPVIVFLISFFAFHNKWGMIGAGALVPIMLTQHIWGHKLLAKRLRREISVAFPQWLMELALLLQSDNVQVSIFKTVDTALPVLQPELIKLRDALIANPNSSLPYMDFFATFQMPEITTAMQKLYSLSTGNGNAEIQIASIVERNNIILDRAEDMANEDSLAGLYVMFLAPVLIGCIVLMVDMSCFLLYFMQNFAAA